MSCTAISLQIQDPLWDFLMLFRYRDFYRNFKTLPKLQTTKSPKGFLPRGLALLDLYFDGCALRLDDPLLEHLVILVDVFNRLDVLHDVHRPA